MPSPLLWLPAGTVARLWGRVLQLALLEREPHELTCIAGAVRSTTSEVDAQSMLAQTRIVFQTLLYTVRLPGRL